MPRPVPVLNRCSRLRLGRGHAAGIVHHLDQRPGPHAPEGELSIAFLGPRAHARLHADFLGDPSPTDVITFPGDPAAGFAGEICLSPARAAELAADQGTPFARELLLYLIHGYLHLAGLDDRTPAARRAMRHAEAAALRDLGRAALPFEASWRSR